MTRLAGYLMFGALMGLITIPLAAQQEQPRSQTGRQDEAKVRQGQLEAVTLYKLDNITGMNVRNDAGKELGEINELVIDPQNGQIRYAALSFGGFLGVGDKLFAIPWQSLTLKHDQEDTYFVLNVSEQKLKNAPGFDADNWPDTANPEFQRGIDQYYGSGAEGREQVREQRSAQQQRAATKSRRSGAASSSGGPLFKASDLAGMDVQNENGEDLGQIDELVIELNEGRVAYAALSFGGFLGVGDKLFAIPWDEFSYEHTAQDEHVLVLNVAPERLKKAPGFDADQWPDVANPEWRQQIETFYTEGDDVQERETTTRRP